MIYLNNAATSFPRPESVISAVKEYLEKVPFHAGRTGFKTDHEDTVSTCRTKLAQLFHVRNPRQIVFTSGSTEALNLAILGMQFHNAHIITTATEHNSVYRPLKQLEREGHIRISIVECNQSGIVNPELIKRAIRKNTRAIIVNHCSNVTGTHLDLETIGNIARTHELIFIVDASQSAGVLPIDVEKQNIDMLAFTGHKSLYGVTGTGGLYIREDLKPRPLKFGGTGVRSDLLLQPEDMPVYYEAGTQNLLGITALNAGLDFIMSTGIEKIRNHKERTAGMIRDTLRQFPEITLYGSQDNTICSAVLCFNIKGLPPEDTGYILENSYDIIVRSGLHCAPLIHQALGSFPEGSVRVSPSYFTTDDEIKTFCEAISSICRAATGM